MTTDQILDELHATRHKLLADAGGTIEGLAADLRKRQRESGRRILQTQRTIPSTEAAKSGDAAVGDQSSPLGDR